MSLMDQEHIGFFIYVVIFALILQMKKSDLQRGFKNFEKLLN